jgi:hypothetical protein
LKLDDKADDIRVVPVPGAGEPRYVDPIDLRVFIVICTLILGAVGPHRALPKFQPPENTMSMITPTSSLLLFHLYATCCLLLSYCVPHHIVAAAPASPFSFSFDFSNTSSYQLDDLRFEGNATLGSGFVDLTYYSGQSAQNCTGRMSYNHPVPFYDTTTGVVASFSTQFNFMIETTGEYAGDGMAFFLSS